jgi:hypothetical protein
MTELASIQERITAAVAKHEFEEAVRLAQIASQLKKLDEQRHHLLAAVQTSTVPDPLPPPLSPFGNGLHAQRITRESRNSGRGGLVVELPTREGIVRISERTASDTLVVLMERILANYGMAYLEKLTLLQVSRGPLLSRDPQSDYLNSKKGELYTHHRIPGTDLYVLTHSDNQQKVKDIRAALRLLGLKDDSFRVSLT